MKGSWFPGVAPETVTRQRLLRTMDILVEQGDELELPPVDFLFDEKQRLQHQVHATMPGSQARSPLPENAVSQRASNRFDGSIKLY